MIYRVGFCPICQNQVMIQDAKGKWVRRKENYAQAYLTFGDGSKVKTCICKGCLIEPDLEKLMEVITHSESQACSKHTSDFIKSMGAPISIERA